MNLPSPLALAAVLAAAGCRPDAQASGQVSAVAQQVIPRVERAVGLPFKRPPGIAVRTRAQVRDYLMRKLDADFPPDELERVTMAYRLFGFIADTTDLRALLLSLYSEQVAGYFDPDSSTLYVIEGTDPAVLRITLAHELVHALQDQYVALDSLLSMKRQNDRKTAAQAVMEGQATLASMVAIMPDQDLTAMPDFWLKYRATVREQQKTMPVISTAPLILREGLIFSYLAGADFARWFAREHPDTVPFGPRLPASTEQILHPDRYARGDAPIELAVKPDRTLIYDDNLGEFEIRILLTELSGSESVGAAGALGWAGDRYAVYQAEPGYALVWWSVWDDEDTARRFAVLLGQHWVKLDRVGRRHAVERVPIGGGQAVRLIDAPKGWSGWQRPPVVIRR